jgi:hypothetical protein
MNMLIVANMSRRPEIQHGMAKAFYSLLLNR